MGWGRIYTVIFMSNPTTVLRLCYGLCCFVVGVVTKQYEIMVIFINILASFWSGIDLSRVITTGRSLELISQLAWS